MWFADHHVHYDIDQERCIDIRTILDRAYDAKVRGMGLLARRLVDIKSLEMAISYGKKLMVDVVPGVEDLALIGPKETVGVVSLGFDYRADLIQSWLGTEATHRRRMFEAKETIRSLRNLGFRFDGLVGEDTYNAFLGGDLHPIGINACKLIQADIHNQRKIQELKAGNQNVWLECSHRYNDPVYSSTLDEKFLYWLLFADGKPLNMTLRIGLSEYIDRIHRAGGVVLYSPEGEFQEDVWLRMLALGIDGIMAWHASTIGECPINDCNDIPLSFVRSAKSRGLLVTGGSDFQNRNWVIGVGKGDMRIPYSVHLELKERIGNMS